jgi:hypothetical protein
MMYLSIRWKELTCDLDKQYENVAYKKLTNLPMELLQSTHCFNHESQNKTQNHKSIQVLKPCSLHIIKYFENMEFRWA